MITDSEYICCSAKGTVLLAHPQQENIPSETTLVMNTIASSHTVTCNKAQLIINTATDTMGHRLYICLKGPQNIYTSLTDLQLLSSLNIFMCLRWISLVVPFIHPLNLWTNIFITCKKLLPWNHFNFVQCREDDRLV